MRNTIAMQQVPHLVFPAQLAPVEKPLHIVHIISSIDPAAGGPATVVVRLAAAQAALGHEVTIVSSIRPDHRSAFEQSTAGIPHFNRVRLLVSPWHNSIKRWFGARLVPVFDSLFPFSDVAHFHGIWEPMLPVAARSLRRHNIPYIVRPCGMLDPWSLRQSGFKKALALRITHRNFLKHAAMIQTLNADESRLMAPLHLAPPQTVIPNGVFLNEIDDRSGEAAFLCRLPQLREKPYILFVGRLHHKKGLDLLGKAFVHIAGKFPETHLLVVGPDGGARAEFCRMISDAQLESRVHLPGPLYGPEKMAAYRHAACFCLPSRQEGFSLSVTEALASRIPVAISRDAHFPEVAEAVAGQLCDLDANSVADALERILTLPWSHRRKLGCAGRMLVEEKYTWERVAGQTIDMYLQLLARK